MFLVTQLVQYYIRYKTSSTFFYCYLAHFNCTFSVHHYKQPAKYTTVSNEIILLYFFSCTCNILTSQTHMFSIILRPKQITGYAQNFIPFEPRVFEIISSGHVCTVLLPYQGVPHRQKCEQPKVKRTL